MQRLIAWRIPLLLLALAATAWAYPWAQRLSFDRTIENMFAGDDPVVPPYRQLKQTFGSDEIALAAYHEARLFQVDSAAGHPGFDETALRRLRQLTEQLRAVPGVRSVFSLSSNPGFDPEASTLARSAARLFEARFLELAEGLVLGTKSQTLAVVCVLEPEATARVPRPATVAQLEQLVRAAPYQGVLTGEPVMVAQGFEHLEDDGRRLGLWSSLLLGLTIVACFRSLRWVLVPAAVVLATLWWTQGLLAVGHFRMTLVSSMLWALVTVICVATVVHLIVGFREARTAGAGPVTALASAGSVLLMPIVWSCLTDAAGFGSLLIASVGPVRDFGAMMVLASLLALAGIGAIVPGLALLGHLDADPRRAWGEDRLESGLNLLSTVIERRPRFLASTIAVGLAVAVAGIARLEVETDFTKNFRSDSELVRAYNVVETGLGGAGVLDVLVAAPDRAGPEFFDRVQRFEDRLRREVPALTKVLSVADMVSLPPHGQIGPDDVDALAADPVTGRIFAALRPMFESLYARDPTTNRAWVRVMLRARERQPAEQKRQVIDDVRRISAESFNSSEPATAPRVTGFFVLLTVLVESVSRDQWLTFGLATLGIFFMMLLAFRRWKLALVALVPNALPILVVTGALGWLGLRINMGAAMIASVSMGLSVDSSIHYISDFLRRRERGDTTRAALRGAEQTVGRAMVFSTLALVVGFSVLCLSEFVPTIYFGVLVSLSMLGGLLGNLVILPLLLTLADTQAAAQK